jgi:hypothetical protein
VSCRIILCTLSLFGKVLWTTSNPVKRTYLGRCVPKFGPNFMLCFLTILNYIRVVIFEQVFFVKCLTLRRTGILLIIMLLVRSLSCSSASQEKCHMFLIFVGLLLTSVDLLYLHIVSMTELSLPSRCYCLPTVKNESRRE